MIYDNISQIERYKRNPKLYAALIALKQFVNGEDYDEKSVAFFSKDECITRIMSEVELENHHKYTDIHYVIEGMERILVSDSRRLERLTNFSEEKDYELFAISKDVRKVDLKAGDFLVVYPGESHAPKVAVNDERTMIKKVVVKYA